MRCDDYVQDDCRSVVSQYKDVSSVRTITVGELYSKADYLIIESSGLSLSLHPLDYDDTCYLNYDDGDFFAQLSMSDNIPILDNGNLLIEDLEVSVYTSQQITF